MIDPRKHAEMCEAAFSAGRASREAEIAALHQQLADHIKREVMLRDAIHDGCLCVAQYGEQPPDCLLEALAVTPSMSEWKTKDELRQQLAEVLEWEEKAFAAHRNIDIEIDRMNGGK